MRGRNQLDAASGTMPRRENTKPKRAVFACDADVHGELHGDADADRGAVDRGDDGLEAFEDLERQAAAAVAHAFVAPVDVSAAALRSGRSARWVASKVAAPADRSAPAQKARPAPVTMMQRTSSSVLARRERVDHLVHHRAGEGVELLRPVQRDGEDVVAHIDCNLFISSGRSSQLSAGLGIE